MHGRGRVILRRNPGGLKECGKLKESCMKHKSVLLILIWVMLAGGTIVHAGQNVLFRINFDRLTDWEPLNFPKIKNHSKYSLVKEGDKSILKAESHASASAIVYRRTFNIYENPQLHWRWKVTQLSDGGNPREKSGDDYPIRVYVMFGYDPAKASLKDRLLYNASKIIYGKYPPHSTLNYVWTGTKIPERFIRSPYTDKASMVVLERGKEKAGQWVEESVNVPEDYRQAFGKEPPDMAGIAVMSDSDNTVTDAEAYLEFIEIGR
jgi:hypothetical protein